MSAGAPVLRERLSGLGGRPLWVVGLPLLLLGIGLALVSYAFEEPQTAERLGRNLPINEAPRIPQTSPPTTRRPCCATRATRAISWWRTESTARASAAPSTSQPTTGPAGRRPRSRHPRASAPVMPRTSPSLATAPSISRLSR